jgi:hypothetical protein
MTRSPLSAGAVGRTYGSGAQFVGKGPIDRDYRRWLWVRRTGPVVRPSTGRCVCHQGTIFDRGVISDELGKHMA